MSTATQNLQITPRVPVKNHARRRPIRISKTINSPHPLRCKRHSMLFAHIHLIPDGSIHLTLPPGVQEDAIDAGWAEPHPLAGLPTISNRILLVYAPRTLEETKPLPHWSRRPGAMPRERLADATPDPVMKRVHFKPRMTEAPILARRAAQMFPALSSARQWCKFTNKACSMYERIEAPVIQCR